MGGSLHKRGEHAYGMSLRLRTSAPVLRDGDRDDGADCVYFSPPEDPSWGYKGAKDEVVLDVNEEHLKYPLPRESVDTDDSCDPPRISRQVDRVPRPFS